MVQVYSTALMKEFIYQIRRGRVENWTLVESKKDYKILEYKPDANIKPIQVYISRNHYEIIISPIWTEDILGNPRRKEFNIIKGYYIGKIIDMLFSNFAGKIDKLEVVK